MTHSQGPWIATGYKNLTVNTAKGNTVTACPGGDANIMGTPVEELQANARLIAAAPDLLDLLAMALPYVEDALTSGDFKPGVVQRDAKRIRDLIAKVGGK